jgi:ornithine carbamoyltransferase
MRHLLEIDDLTAEELFLVLEIASASRWPAVLEGRGVALVFEKPSVRTRNSMEMAVFQLGGHPVTIRPDEVGLDSRETVEDVTRTLAGYHSVIAARVYEHAKLERMVAVSSVPIVNLLSDQAHPMQALADLLTLQQRFGSLEGRRLAYVGDGNNVCRSLALAAALAGMEMRVATPEGYGLAPDDVTRIEAVGQPLVVTNDPKEAVAGADALYTDVWTSMGQEEESARRRADFDGFTIDESLLGLLDDAGVFLHCLPAHRGEEVTDEVLEGDRSLVWQQAANRMHAARGLLAWIARSEKDDR